VQAQIDKKEALFQNTNREIAQLKELNQTLADTEAQLKKVSEAGAGQDPGKKAAATAVAEAAARTIREQAAEKQLQFETDQMAIRAEMANAEGAAILEKQIQLQDLQFQNATTHADKMQALRNKAALTQALTVAKAAENEKKLEDDKNKDMVANRTAFLSQMATLQSSGNQTLIAIGRAAAIASITIATADAAMKSYAFGAALGGPFLGGTFQALAIAAGAIQAAKVAGVSMADGGLVTGGIAGVDSVPAMLMPGEFVAPARDADAIIDAAARDRAGEGGAAHVVIELKDGLMDFIEAKLVERQRLGISIQGA
jgi:chemotaxis protein histidine kinase CheA